MVENAIMTARMADEMEEVRMVVRSVLALFWKCFFSFLVK